MKKLFRLNARCLAMVLITSAAMAHWRYQPSAVKTYEKLRAFFNPVKFDSRESIQMAKRADRRESSNSR